MEESLSLANLARLLQLGAAPDAEEQRELFRHFVRQHWSPTVMYLRYIAPIYVSSFCIDACPYCNFSANRRTAIRRRLSLEELEREVRQVLERDMRVIELVYATDPEFTTDLLVRYVAKVVELLDGEPGTGVLLCTEYLTNEAYLALRDAGLWGIVQWDETLDRRAYRRWHSPSPQKREFELRMDNHDRAMAAGLEVATGALFGLADFRYDVLMQIAKARHLAEQYGRGPFVFGTARLKPIAGQNLHLQTEVSDGAYETSLLVYKLAMPNAGRWLQTRETFELNLKNLLDGDVFTYRCGEVRPGGYQASEKQLKGGQFGVNELERDYVESKLAERNVRISYAWINPEKPVYSALPAVGCRKTQAGHTL
ncbi:MAG TPA: radical SAM protein [Terriglobales bacterium]|nr:radical SAM protein [Terriglobales bacterium]